MIDQINLTNFQCHKSVTVDLAKITTIVGQSDSGKSAILRAFNWVCFNAGRPSMFIKRGETSCSASVIVDGHTVERFTKGNSYVIDGVPLNSIGRSLPEEVTSVFRMSEDNIQTQHDYLFWFAAKGGELTKNLNRIVDLTKLDNWVKTGSTQERQFRENVRYHSQRIEELEEEADSLRQYVDMAKELDVLNSNNRDILSSRNSISRLSDVVSEYGSNESRYSYLVSYMKELNIVIQKQDELVLIKRKIDVLLSYTKCSESLNTAKRFSFELNAVLVSYSSIVEVVNKRKVISGILSQISSTKISLADYKELASVKIPFDDLFDTVKKQSSLKKIFSGICGNIPSVQSVIDSFRESSACFSKKEQLSVLCRKLADTSDVLSEARNAYQHLHNEFIENLEGICPLCGGPIHEEE